MKQKGSICLFQRQLQSPVFTEDTEIRDLVFAFQNFMDCLGRQSIKQIIIIECTTCSKGVNTGVAQRLPESGRGRRWGCDRVEKPFEKGR